MEGFEDQAAISKNCPYATKHGSVRYLREKRHDDRECYRMVGAEGFEPYSAKTGKLNDLNDFRKLLNYKLVVRSKSWAGVAMVAPVGWISLKNGITGITKKPVPHAFKRVDWSP
jgi:hypothetical protein